MEYTSKRRKDGCHIIKKIINGRRTFKCKKLKRLPTAEEIVESLKK